jgi:hypothetical protein
MNKRKYFSWTDEKREELRNFVDNLLKAGVTKAAAFESAGLKFGVSSSSCMGGYEYKPKTSIVTEVDPEDLEARKQRAAREKLKTLTELKQISSTSKKSLKIDIHNDINNQALVINLNKDITIIKVGDILVSIQNG